jgi:hypothetical protein
MMMLWVASQGGWWIGTWETPATKSSTSAVTSSSDIFSALLIPNSRLTWCPRTVSQINASLLYQSPLFSEFSAIKQLPL